jgi:DNA polymerase
MNNCTACDLCHNRTNVVFGEGSKNPLIMIVGEAPGEDEDITGVPFVGKAGQKLNNILDYIGVTREEVYITNAALCRPPNNRNPRAQELDACKWRLNLQIQLLKPKLIILLGKIATEQIYSKPIKGSLNQFFTEKIKNDNGWLKYIIGEHEALMLITYHPSYHLRSPQRAYKTTLPHWTKVKEWIAQEKQNA